MIHFYEEEDRQSSLILNHVGPEVANFCDRYVDLSSSTIQVLSTSNVFNLTTLPFGEYAGIVNFTKMNDARRINVFLETLNSKLYLNGYFIGCVETYADRRKKIFSKYIPPFNWFIYLADSFIHRFMPKFSLTKRVYFYLTKGIGRMVSRAEMFGRLYSCGFEVVDQLSAKNKLFFVAKKTGEPHFDQNATYGPLIKLRRVGKDGKIFRVYKLRTMYPYSEYLQDYVFKHHQLDEGGKFKNDFRISPIGRFFRKFWIDELPMFWNLIKGDMKLVGVRPLSKHYFSLYTAEVQELRTRVKPGLIPPFYADMPKTLDDIILSEKKYLELYAKNPFSTDVSYFFKIFTNILFRGARSK
jgi:lipopolysaccharide/colanic/teichoic acid biosynthesis glycosyltransferase